MRVSVDVEGHAAKRGLIPRLPAPDRLAADVGTWLSAEYPDAVRHVLARELPSGKVQLRAALHPAASDLLLTASEDGLVTISAQVDPVGPGYHTFVQRLVRRLGIEMEVEWGTDDDLGLERMPAPSRFDLDGVPIPVGAAASNGGSRDRDGQRRGGGRGVARRVAAKTGITAAKSGITAATRLAVGAAVVARETATDLASDLVAEVAEERVSAEERAERAAAERAQATEERATAERSALKWLGAELLASREGRRGTGRTVGDTIGGFHLGTPPGVRFGFAGRLATVLGPRDDAWLNRAAADPRVAIDVVPWWADATDARYLLNRALCLMWTEIRWRPPIADGERDVIEETLRLLSRAFPLDPGLPYPWHEWQEIIEMRGFEDHTARQIRERASAAELDRPRIGYRRQPVTIIHEGWALDVPGSFADRRTDEEWWGGEGGRTVTLAATETGTAEGPMRAEAFLQQVCGDLGSDALSHRAGDVVGRARLSTDTSSGVEVGVLEGYSAVLGRGAAIRITFDDTADWQWALDLWRGLAPV